MKKLTVLFALILVALPACVFASSHDWSLPQLERVVYGAEKIGALQNRLGTLERDLFGRDLPGDQSTRERSLAQFMNSNGDSPSLVYKTDMISWALGDGDSFLLPLAQRVSQLESLAGAEQLVGKPIAMRVERLLGDTFAGELTPQSVTVPAGMVVRVALVTPIGANTPSGTPVLIQTTSDLILNGQMLVAPRGSVVRGTVKSLSARGGLKPTFDVQVSLNGLEALGDAPLPLVQSGGETNLLSLKGEGRGIASGSTLLLQIAVDSPSQGFLVNDESIKAFRNRYAEKPQSFKTPEYARATEPEIKEPVTVTTETENKTTTYKEGWSLENAFYLQGKDGKPIYPKEVERKRDEKRREKTDPAPKDDSGSGGNESQEYQWL